jgi:hypothetical protein
MMSYSYVSLPCNRQQWRWLTRTLDLHEMKFSQAQKELAVFNSFLKEAPLLVDRGSIESRKPPEPDIVCNVIGVGRIGFELTEIVDESFMIRIAKMAATNRHLNQYWKKTLPEDENDIFRSKYSDAAILVSYVALPAESASKKLPPKRETLSPQIFSFLNALPDGAFGRFNSARVKVVVA